MERNGFTVGAVIAAGMLSVMAAWGLVEMSTPMSQGSLDEAHPGSDAYCWKPLFAADLSDAEFAAGSWAYDAEGNLAAQAGKPIWTKADWENYVLDFEYRMEKGGNDGVFLYVSNLDKFPKYKIEVQLMDDFGEASAIRERTYQQTGSIYGRAAAREVTSKRAGEWNRMTIYCRGKKIRVIHNGKRVLDVDFADWRDPLVNPDGTVVPKWHRDFPLLSTIPTKGRIGFQGRHGDRLPDGRNAGCVVRNARLAPLD